MTTPWAADLPDLFDLLFGAGAEPGTGAEKRKALQAELARLKQRDLEQKEELAALEAQREVFRTSLLGEAETATQGATAALTQAGRVWDLVADALRNGLGGGLAREAVQLTMACIDNSLTWAGVASGLRDFARECGLSPTGVDDLARAVEHIRGVRPTAAKVLAALSAPPPRFDLAEWDRAAAGMAAARFRTPDQIRAALRQSPDGES